LKEVLFLDGFYNEKFDVYFRLIVIQTILRREGVNIKDSLATIDRGDVLLYWSRIFCWFIENDQIWLVQKSYDDFIIHLLFLIVYIHLENVSSPFEILEKNY
jgi:hypothetical protein